MSESTRLAVSPAEPLIYYLRRDDLIKIGHTTRFAVRMRKLRPDELLAVEPGPLALETGRQHQFASHRVVDHPDGREWYRPAPELLAHIERMARLYEAPELPRRRGPRSPLAESPTAQPAGGRGRRTYPLGALAETLTIEDVMRFNAMNADERDGLSDDYLMAIMQRARYEYAQRGRYTAELYRRGWSWRRIAEVMGVDQSTVHRSSQPFLADAAPALDVLRAAATKHAACAAEVAASRADLHEAIREDLAAGRSIGDVARDADYAREHVRRIGGPRREHLAATPEGASA